jgi:hypothetical protein
MGATRTIFFAVALFVAASRSWAGEPVLWLVSADDDPAAWEAAAARTWPEGGVAVVSWHGAWPPAPDAGPAAPHAFFEGTLPEGVIVARSLDGVERRVPLTLRGVGEDEGRRAALLVLSSIHQPVTVSDSGWRPTEPTAPPVPPTGDEAGDRPLVVLEDPPLSRGLRITPAVGASYRRGLDQVSVAPSIRGGFVIGPADRSRVRVVGELAFDLLGRTRVGGRSVWVHGASLVAALEVRPGVRRMTFPMWLGLGGGMLWAARVDGGGRQASAGAPVLRGGVGWEWAAPSGLHLGLRLALGAELVGGASPIQVRAEFDGVLWSRTLSPLTVTLQGVVDLGDPRPAVSDGSRAPRKP